MVFSQHRLRQIIHKWLEPFLEIYEGEQNREWTHISEKDMFQWIFKADDPMVDTLKLIKITVEKVTSDRWKLYQDDNRDKPFMVITDKGLWCPKTGIKTFSNFIDFNQLYEMIAEVNCDNAL